MKKNLPPLGLKGKKILVIGHAFIGDALMTTPLILALVAQSPAKLGVIAKNPGLEVYRRLPSKPRVHDRADKGLVKEVKNLDYELCFVLKDDLASAILARRLGIPLRIGFARELSSLFLTRTIKPREVHSHGALRYFPLAGLPLPAMPKTQFEPSPDERARATELLTGVKPPFVVLAPSTTRPEKDWPLANAREFLELVKSRGLTIVVVGGPGDRARHARLSQGTPALDLTGETTPWEAAAIIEKAALVIAADSGPMHLAAALERPLIALFGQTDPAHCGPCSTQVRILRAQTPCHPCLNKRCGSNAPCMASIKAKAVLAALDEDFYTKISRHNLLVCFFC